MTTTSMRSQRGAMDIVLIVIVALALGLGAWAGYSGMFRAGLHVSPSPAPEPGTSEQPSKVSTVGTGTYTNKEFGFSFVIPAPLVGLETAYPDSIYVNVGTEKEISEIRSLEGVGYRDFLSINVSQGAFTPAQRAGVMNCAEYHSSAPITIAGASGLKCTGLAFTGTVDPDTVLFQFFSPTEPNILFVIESDQYTGANIARIDQILATLKFTAPEWKTYTNTQYGFSFQYPGAHADLTTYGQNSDGYIITTNLSEGGAITVQAVQGKPSDRYKGLSTPTALTLDTLAAQRYTYTNNGVGCDGILVAVPSKNLEISFNDCYPGGEAPNFPEPYQIQAFNQILATFKFAQ